jgi:hypothetical protein
VFDDLSSTGKPLDIKPTGGDGDYGQVWVRDYARARSGLVT